MNVEKNVYICHLKYNNQILMLCMSLQHSLLQQWFSHFQQCYQYLLSYVKGKNALEYRMTTRI